jgi:putative Holliday junction resolvase
MSRIIGLDIGDKRIGVAMSDPTETLASPHSIIERITDDQAITDILKITAEYSVVRIIAGLPRSLGGDIGHQAEKVQFFTEELTKHTTIPIEYRDERFTTVTAKQLKQEGSAKKLKRTLRYDAMAAAIILQEYLDEKAVKARQSSRE